ncbi:MAG: tetratricopeptide repeat protein [Armatimonadota bacterium]
MNGRAHILTKTRVGHWAFVLVLLAACVVVICTGCGRESDNLTGLSPEVEQARDQFGAERSVEILKAEAEAQQTAAAWERLAQAYTLVNDPEEMKEALQKALEKDAEYPRAVVGMTVILLGENKPEEAEQMIRRLLDADNNGGAFLRQWTPILWMIRRLLDADNNGPGAAQLLAGRALMQQDKIDEAIELLRDATGTNPNYPPLYYGLGDAQLAAGEPAEAAASYKKAAAQDPAERLYRRALVRAHVQAEQFDKAVEAAGEAVEALPDDAVMWFVAGTVYARTDEIDKAIHAYEQALLINPNFAAAANNLAVLLADEGKQLNRATKLVRKAIQIYRSNHAFADTYGWVLVRSGEYEQGIELLRMVQENWSNSPAVKWHLGYGLVKSGKVAEGKKLVEEAAAAKNRPDIASAAREFLDSLESE